MTNPSAPKRASLTVDLGRLREPAQAAAAAHGVAIGTWIRSLVAGAIAPADEPSNAGLKAPSKAAGAMGRAGEGLAPAGPARAAGEPVEVRWMLDADLVAELDRLVDRGGFRTRSGALNALMRGADLSGGPELAEAVRALSASSDDLVTVRRQLQRISDSLDRLPQRLFVAEQLQLVASVRQVREHLTLASSVLTRLAPGFRAGTR